MLQQPNVGNLKMLCKIKNSGLFRDFINKSKSQKILSIRIAILILKFQKS